jgi:hypothetical protein
MEEKRDGRAAAVTDRWSLEERKENNLEKTSGRRERRIIWRRCLTLLTCFTFLTFFSLSR